jgi:hypothetical protein
MRYVPRWSIIWLLSVLGQVQPAACGGSSPFLVEAPTIAARPGHQSPPAANLANFAGGERCKERPVAVTASSSDEHRLTCSAANDALQLLGTCNITLRRPLHVQIMSEVRHPFSGAIFGLFDTKQDRVLVTQEANIPALVEGTPYAALPQRDFYRSLIVHEVIHGVMHQNLKRAAASHAAYEYPAYALQIESLAPNVREDFLRSFDQTALKASLLCSMIRFSSSTRTSLPPALTTTSRLQPMVALISPPCWKVRSPSSLHPSCSESQAASQCRGGNQCLSRFRRP